MRWIESLLRFLWDFIIGDDWRIAVGVVLALGVTALVEEPVQGGAGAGDVCAEGAGLANRLGERRAREVVRR